jgi:hypothetical protein
MALESVTDISDLNASNPTSTDPVVEGDDHIRNIKTALLTDFPNISGAMTATHTELNYNAAVTPGAVTASKTLMAGSSSELDALTITTLTTDAMATSTNADLVISPNGTGDVDLNGCSLMLDTSEGIKDSGGSSYIVFTEDTTPATWLGIENADTGLNPIISALGEADTGIRFENDQSEELMIMECVATAVNEVTITNAASGNGPIVAATGDGTNIDLNLNPKGSGGVVVNGNFITAETATATGSVAIPITAPVMEITSSGASDAMTLADGAEGQHLYIIHVSDGGDADITPNAFGQGTSFNLATVGDSVHLLFTAASWWMMSSGYGDPVVT